MTTLQAKIDILTTAAAAIQTVESAFRPSPDAPAASSGKKKMQAAIALLMVLSPQAAAVLGPLEVVLQGVFNMMTLFGTLKRSPPPSVEPAAKNLSNTTTAG